MKQMALKKKKILLAKSPCPIGNKQNASRPREDRVHSTVQLAVPTRAPTCQGSRLVHGPFLQVLPARFPETRYTDLQTRNILWQRQRGRSYALSAHCEPGKLLQLSARERSPPGDRFPENLEALCKAAGLTEQRLGPVSPGMEDGKREAPTVPDRRGGSCCGRPGAGSGPGAADAASAAGPRTCELCPGTAAPGCSCLH